MIQNEHSSVTVRLIEEYATLEFILLGDLRDLLEDDFDERTRAWLTAVINALFETVPREFELQEQQGYLTHVLEEFPNWTPQVDQLRAERKEIHNRLLELRTLLLANKPFDEIAETLRVELRDWMNSLMAHHRHERRIVQTAFNLDVGSGE